MPVGPVTIGMGTAAHVPTIYPGRAEKFRDNEWVR